MIFFALLSCLAANAETIALPSLEWAVTDAEFIVKARMVGQEVEVAEVLFAKTPYRQDLLEPGTMLQDAVPVNHSAAGGRNQRVRCVGVAGRAGLRP